MDCYVASNAVFCRTIQVTISEHTEESSAFQQCYIVLYAKHLCDMTHFLQVFIDIRAMYISFAIMVLVLFSSEQI